MRQSRNRRRCTTAPSGWCANRNASMTRNGRRSARTRRRWGPAPSDVPPGFATDSGRNVCDIKGRQSSLLFGRQGPQVRILPLRPAKLGTRKNSWAPRRDLGVRRAFVPKKSAGFLERVHFSSCQSGESGRAVATTLALYLQRAVYGNSTTSEPSRARRAGRAAGDGGRLRISLIHLRGCRLPSC